MSLSVDSFAVSGFTTASDLGQRLAAAALARGECVILVDEASGTADFVAAAELVTGDLIAFMAVEGRGLTTLALPATRVDELRLPPMARGWHRHATPATVSIEARDGVTTGISAPDRARTIRVAVDAESGADDLISPGHVFPVRVEEPGDGCSWPRARAAMALALAAEAGLGRGAVLCEILDESGEHAGPDHLAKLAQRFSLSQVSFGEIVG